MIIKGAVAMVTGGARGIGYAFCEELLKQGAKVVVLIDVLTGEGTDAQASLQAEYGPGSAVFIECDVTKNEDLKSAMNTVIKEHGKLDILCNNAGVAHQTDWEKTLNVNLGGVIRGTKLGLELMSSGAIINTASAAGIAPWGIGPVYSATKSGVIGFTRATAISQEAVEKGIRVNCLCPGATDTPVIRKAMENLPIVLKKPLMRTEVIAKALIQLIANDSKNGEALVILDEQTSGYHQFNELGVFKPN
ncbi:15-hydroxyprostaglandin dehydrogenase [NAD(+)] isoform X1 [Exaiptasia diaphana]|uniref:15-hydroxyprostaglandin dehydrogenase [NAD(+)] n=1 Tax=Exaiptasia diaphana TaxID=2652724 RepID=A0A913YKB5_EXADI|nr:15-hydroxyprostaglandin dehydrogenase [NAD(+)] isoform X1 [Exaiptasia diaphana]KXJ14068.1 15-hydroxyprostaglandin dehydrogenase [NAD(+)] [Exaiptasia diaphana]